MSSTGLSIRVRGLPVFTQLLATAGRVFWGIVELSVPNSLAFRFMTHWLKLLTALSILMIVFGTIFKVGSMAPFGWKFLAIIMLGDILRGILHDFMITATWPTKMIVDLVVLIVAAALGYLVAEYGDDMACGLHWLAHLLQHMHEIAHLILSV